MSFSPPPSPEELFSAAYDYGHWDAASDSDLSAENAARLASEWQQLGEDLRNLAVKPVGTGLSANVRAQLLAKSQPVVTETNGTKITSTRQASGTVLPARRSTAIAASLAAILLVTVMLAGYSVQPRPDARVANLRQKLDPAAWEVVVITVPDEQSSLLTAQLRESVSQRGYQIRSVTGSTSASDDVLELVMASAETSEQFLDVLSSGTRPFTTEWNPDQIGEFNRDELLQRLAASMETPTQSDQFFGETFVVLQDSEAMQIAAVPTVGSHQVSELAANGTPAAMPQGSETRTRTSEIVPDGSVARVVNLLQNNTNRPVLVVFKKKPKLQSEIRITDPPRSEAFTALIAS